MRKPVVDYRELRLSRLNEPRFAHLKLLGGWIVYFILFFLTVEFMDVNGYRLIIAFCNINERPAEICIRKHHHIAVGNTGRHHRHIIIYITKILDIFKYLLVSFFIT